MSRFRNSATGVVVSVDDSKDGRFVNGWERADAPTPVKSKSARKPAQTK